MWNDDLYSKTHFARFTKDNDRVADLLNGEKWYCPIEDMFIFNKELLSGCFANRYFEEMYWCCSWQSDDRDLPYLVGEKGVFFTKEIIAWWLPLADDIRQMDKAEESGQCKG